MIIIPTFVVRYVNLNSSLVILGCVVLLITIFRVNSKNIIFVTDDVKEDWFNIINGEKQ